MAAQFSNLRQRKGYIRIFQLLSSFIGLILIITAIIFHQTDSFVGYEASFTTIISLTTASSRSQCIMHLSSAFPPANTPQQFCWTLFWSISALCILLFRGTYPAGVDVGLDLIGWGLAWGFGIVLIQWAASMDYPRSCEYRNTSNTFCINSRALMACEVVGGIMALLYGYVCCSLPRGCLHCCITALLGFECSTD